MSEQTRVILHHLPPMLFPCAKNPAEAAAVTMSTAPAGNPLMLSPVVIFGRDRTPPRTSSPLFVEVSARPSVRASSCRLSTFRAFSPRQQLQALYFQSLLRLSSSRHWLTPVILVGAPYRTPGRMSSGRRWSRWSVSSRGRGRRLSLSKSWPFLNLKHELAGPTTAASRLLSPKGVRALGFLMSPGT